MNVILAYSHIAPGVREALDATGTDWSSWYTGASDDAYWRLLDTLWRIGDTFVIVEHDVLVRPDTFRELAECPSEWCTFAIPYLGSEYPGMGCAKFTADLIAAVPDAVQWAGQQSNARHEPRHWCLLDNGIRQALARARFQPCEHRPALGHWRPYAGIPQPSHGCCGQPVPHETTA